MPARKEITTKTNYTVSESYCRKCVDMRPASDFYEAMDMGFADSVGLLSICKTSINEMYDDMISQKMTIEQAIHRLCIVLNVKYSNEAMASTKTHVQTLIDSGKNVSAVFGIYLSKIVSLNKSMDKSIQTDNSYEDVSVIFTSKELNTEVQIPQDIIDFWVNAKTPEDIKYLENEYMQFKQNHSTETHAEVTLLKRVCYTLLDIKMAMSNGDSTDKLDKTLQELMKNLAIAPGAKNAPNQDKGGDSFGMWIQDIEQNEPAQWLKTDKNYDLYKDVYNTEDYFQKYIVRPLKNFITMSKDFNVEDAEIDEDDLILDNDDLITFNQLDREE